MNALSVLVSEEGNSISMCIHKRKRKRKKRNQYINHLKRIQTQTFQLKSNYRRSEKVPDGAFCPNQDKHTSLVAVLEFLQRYVHRNFNLFIDPDVFQPSGFF